MRSPISVEPLAGTENPVIPDSESGGTSRVSDDMGALATVLTAKKPEKGHPATPPRYTRLPFSRLYGLAKPNECEGTVASIPRVLANIRPNQ